MSRLNFKSTICKACHPESSCNRTLICCFHFLSYSWLVFWSFLQSVGHFYHVIEHSRVKLPSVLGSLCKYQTLCMGGLNPLQFFEALANTRHHAKEFWQSVKVCLSSTKIWLRSLVRCWISLSNLTWMAKSPFLKNQKSLREFKACFELVRLRATTFTPIISLEYALFFKHWLCKIHQ